MTTLKLLYGGILRHKVVTFLILMTIAMSFLFYGVLTPISRSLSGEGNSISDDHLIVIHRVSPIETLPLFYQLFIDSINGVEQTTHATWFGGYYQDLNNQRPMWVIDAASYMRLRTEFDFNKQEYESWMESPNGVAIGRKFANRYQLSVGDHLPLKSYIWEKKDQQSNWEFEISAIVDGGVDADLDQVFIHYDYFDLNRSFGVNTVGFFILKASPNANSHEIAMLIDKEYENSPAPTKTASLNSFVKTFTNQLGNIEFIIGGVLILSFSLTLLMVISHFIYVNKRRSSEWAILQAMGFSKNRIASYLLMEIVLLIGLGWFIGMSITIEIVATVAPAISDFIPNFQFTPRDWTNSIILCLVGVFVCSVFPLRQLHAIQLAPLLRSRS